MRLAQRQNVRVSLQPSPYGGTTAVVFIPDALLTDDVPDTNGIGFRLDRPRPSKEAELEEAQRVSLTRGPAQLAGRTPAILDGPVELEAPVDLDALHEFPGVLDSEDSERGGLFRPRRSLAQVDDEAPVTDGADIGDGGPDAPVSLSRRRTPKLVTSHGRPVTDERAGREETDEPPHDRPGRVPAAGDSVGGAGARALRTSDAAQSPPRRGPAPGHRRGRPSRRADGSTDLLGIPEP